MITLTKESAKYRQLLSQSDDNYMDDNFYDMFGRYHKIDFDKISKINMLKLV
jgi:hypothetical protein